MKQLFPALFVALPLLAGAQTIDWATDVAPILYNHCVSCHSDDGIGHFSLLGYNNAYANRYGIQYMTETKQMPPWKADPEYRHFTGENILSDSEIETISQWVNNNGPMGDPALAPQEPVFIPGSSIGMPDHIVTTPLYTSSASADEYRCFVIPTGLQQNKFLSALEVLPGNHQMVHHVLIFEDVSGQGAVLDAQTPEPGYLSFGGTGVANARLIGAWVPGSQARLYPDGTGIKLNAGSDLIVQMHYPSGVMGMSDQTTFNIFYTAASTGVRELQINSLLNHVAPSLQNGPLFIPANAVKTFHAQYTVPFPGSVISVAPHMHYIGSSMKVFAVTLQNDTIPIINIPEWDFHWQGFYTFQYVEKIPIGAKLHAYATYNNTVNNPFQPSFPPQNVWLGEATTDEMLLVYFTYMGYQTGDENILLDSSLLNTNLPLVPETATLGSLGVYPNPATNHITVDAGLGNAAELQLSLLDIQGRIWHEQSLGYLPAGQHTFSINLPIGMPPGTFVARLQDGKGEVISTTFLVK